MTNISKGDVWKGIDDGWRVVITKITTTQVTFFAGYDTITEDISLFLSGYEKE